MKERGSSVKETERELWEAFIATIGTDNLTERERIFEKLAENEIELARKELQRTE